MLRPERLALVMRTAAGEGFECSQLEGLPLRRGSGVNRDRVSATLVALVILKVIPRRVLEPKGPVGSSSSSYP